MIKSLYYTFLILALSLLACQEQTNQEVMQVSSETSDMINELKSIALDKSDITLWHLNRDRAVMIDNKIQSTTNPGQRINMLFQSGTEWLNAGDYNTSIERFNTLLKYIKSENVNLKDETLNKLNELRGVAYLRKAEIENCLENHNAYSCIFPIEKDGIHLKKSGGLAALDIFRSILQGSPTPQTLWLYNITHMALGTYPDQVEPQFLLKPELFESETGFPRFTDMAMPLGLAVNDISGSVVMDDFNNDNYLDLLVSSYGLDDQLRYFENDKKGGFKEKTKEAKLIGLLSGLNMVQADYNNDGWIDVLVLRGAWLGKSGAHPNSLLRNNGDGTFSDVTKSSGLYSKFPTQTASWADFNADGWVDLFIGNEHSKVTHAPTQLFMNNGNGTFSDVSIEKNASIKSFIKGCIWGDINNDGYADIYISSISGPNYLLKNGGPKNNFIFENISITSGTQEPQQSFPCWFFDYNQDGWEDIFVSGFDFNQFETAAGEVAKDYLGIAIEATLPKLYKNNGDNTFSDVTSNTSIDHVLYTMGCNFGDLNNDGFPDFYSATGTPDFRSLIPNRMFLNNNGKTFLEVSKAGGFGHLQKGHGVAFGDIDNDGDQDIYNVLGGSYDGDNFMNALFINPGFENNWLKIKLKGVKSNRYGIGARSSIFAKNDLGESKVFYNTLNSGASFGANPLWIDQGLKDYSTIEKIEIMWPGGKKQILKNIEANQMILITEDSSKIEYINVKRIELKGSHAHDHH